MSITRDKARRFIIGLLERTSSLLEEDPLDKVSGKTSAIQYVRYPLEFTDLETSKKHYGLVYAFLSEEREMVMQLADRPRRTSDCRTARMEAARLIPSLST